MVSEAGWWTDGWDGRYARVLAEAETNEARAVLVDTNGDGRELWFRMDGRAPTGDWVYLLDWDDVGGHHPPELLQLGPEVVFGWGTGRPRERKTATFDGIELPVRVNRHGWWLLLQDPPEPRTATDKR